jgi:hypothetical protein
LERAAAHWAGSGATVVVEEAELEAEELGVVGAIKMCRTARVSFWKKDALWAS